MRMFKNLLIATSLIASASVLAEDCTPPTMPEVPDGASATMDEMIAGQGAVKAFQADAQAFRACVDGKLEGLKAAATNGDEGAAEIYKSTTEAYNASVSDEEKLAEAFNSAIRAYKEANPS